MYGKLCEVKLKCPATNSTERNFSLVDRTVYRISLRSVMFSSHVRHATSAVVSSSKRERARWRHSAFKIAFAEAKTRTPPSHALIELRFSTCLDVLPAKTDGRRRRTCAGDADENDPSSSALLHPSVRPFPSVFADVRNFQLVKTSRGMAKRTGGETSLGETSFLWGETFRLLIPFS